MVCTLLLMPTLMAVVMLTINGREYKCMLCNDDGGGGGDCRVSVSMKQLVCPDGIVVIVISVMTKKKMVVMVVIVE